MLHLIPSSVSSIPPPPDIKPKLAGVQPRVHAGNNQHDRDDDRPQLDIQHVDVEPREDGTDHRSQDQGEEQVAASTVVFPHSFCVVDATKHAGDAPHQEADNVLREQDEARGDAQVAVDAVEVAVGPLLDLVGLDDEHAGAEEEETQQVERGV